MVLAQGSLLRLTLIGDFAASAAGRDIPVASTAGRLLLGYLALNPQRSERREKLAAILWEESDDHRARRNLRQVLHHLRTDLGRNWDGLDADKTHVSLRGGHVVSDIEEIVDDLQAGRVPDALLTPHGIQNRLLATVPEAGELLTSWVRLTRTGIENTLRSALETIMERGEPQQAERAAQALLCLDASDEQAARYLIELYGGRGDTGRALQVYKALWDHLDDQFGMEPAPQTQDLIVQVKSGDLPTREPAARTETAPAAPVGRRLAIGVLPLSSAGRTGEAAEIGDLFRTELIFRMARFREFDVIDAGINPTPTQYALKLILAPGGDQIVLLATLTRSADGTVLWGDRIEQVAQQWWTHQARLAGKLAAACSLNLSRARLSEIAHLPGSSDALDNWLLGQRFLTRFRSDRWERAAACYRKAMQIDPGFSMAFSSLAQLYNVRHLVNPGQKPDPELFGESRSLANRAIALDPLDSRAHLCRAWASCMLGDFAQAEAGFAIARQCNENDPWIVISCALGSAFCGDIDTANDLSDRFLKEGWTTTAPHWGYHATLRFLGGDDAGCIAAAENAGDGILNIPAWRAAALWHCARYEEASAAWRVFEDRARQQWTVSQDASTEAVLDWFLSGFPIRMDDARDRLAEGVRSAAFFQASPSA